MLGIQAISSIKQLLSKIKLSLLTRVSPLTGPALQPDHCITITNSERNKRHVHMLVHPLHPLSLPFMHPLQLPHL